MNAPCPFCGGARLLVQSESGVGGVLSHVACDDCHARGPLELCERELEAERAAQHRWNTRVGYHWTKVTW